MNKNPRLTAAIDAWIKMDIFKARSASANFLGRLEGLSEIREIKPDELAEQLEKAVEYGGRQ